MCSLQASDHGENKIALPFLEIEGEAPIAKLAPVPSPLEALGAIVTERLTHLESVYQAHITEMRRNQACQNEIPNTPENKNLSQYNTEKERFLRTNITDFQFYRDKVIAIENEADQSRGFDIGGLYAMIKYIYQDNQSLLAYSQASLDIFSEQAKEDIFQIGVMEKMLFQLEKLDISKPHKHFHHSIQTFGKRNCILKKPNDCNCPVKLHEIKTKLTSFSRILVPRKTLSNDRKSKLLELTSKQIEATIRAKYDSIAQECGDLTAEYDRKTHQYKVNMNSPQGVFAFARYMPLIHYWFISESLSCADEIGKISALLDCAIAYGTALGESGSNSLKILQEREMKFFNAFELYQQQQCQKQLLGEEVQDGHQEIVDDEVLSGSEEDITAQDPFPKNLKKKKKKSKKKKKVKKQDQENTTYGIEGFFYMKYIETIEDASSYYRKFGRTIRTGTHALDTFFTSYDPNDAWQINGSKFENLEKFVVDYLCCQDKEEEKVVVASGSMSEKRSAERLEMLQAFFNFK